jgi:hypothetical protein
MAGGRTCEIMAHGQATPTQAMTAAAEAKALTEVMATRVRAAVTGRWRGLWRLAAF